MWETSLSLLIYVQSRHSYIHIYWTHEWCCGGKMTKRLTPWCYDIWPAGWVQTDMGGAGRVIWDRECSAHGGDRHCGCGCSSGCNCGCGCSSGCNCGCSSGCGYICSTHHICFSHIGGRTATFSIDECATNVVDILNRTIALQDPTADLTATYDGPSTSGSGGGSGSGTVFSCECRVFCILSCM